MSVGEARARFDRDTGVEPLGDGRYRVRIDRGWWVVAGPNGGYVAALVLRAILAELDDASRPPRSLTLHFLGPPAEGEAVVEVRREREGRSLSTFSARLLQGDRVLTLALCACSGPREAALDFADPAPEAPPPAEAERLVQEGGVPMAARLEMRPTLGAAPFSAAGDSLTGGWLRLAEPRELDAPVLALYADAWLPAPFTRLTAPSAAPTVDLTIHFRAQPEPDPEQYVFVRVRSSTSHEGFFEEDVELWSRDGVLLAQSRQLALLIPPRS